MADRDDRTRRPGSHRRGSGVPRSNGASLLGSGGHYENVIKLCPPLTIDERLLDTALELTIDTIRGTPMTQTAPSVIRSPTTSTAPGRRPRPARRSRAATRPPATSSRSRRGRASRTSAAAIAAARADVRRRRLAGHLGTRAGGDPVRARRPAARGGRAARPPRRDRDGQADPLRPRARDRAGDRPDPVLRERRPDDPRRGHVLGAEPPAQLHPQGAGRGVRR